MGCLNVRPRACHSKCNKLQANYYSFQIGRLTNPPFRTVRTWDFVDYFEPVEENSTHSPCAVHVACGKELAQKYINICFRSCVTRARPSAQLGNSMTVTIIIMKHICTTKFVELKVKLFLTSPSSTGPQFFSSYFRHDQPSNTTTLQN